MLEELLPRWRGKTFVLCLLGFAATDFVITITLSAADATKHIIGNPFVPPAFDHPVALTLMLLALLSAVFLKGFKEAIGIAVVIVARLPRAQRRRDWAGHRAYSRAPGVLPALEERAVRAARQPLDDARGVAPALSEARAGAVRIRDRRGGDAAREGSARRHRADPAGRIANTKKLLRTAALIMTVLLMGSSFATDVADSAGGVPARRSRRPAARSPISPTSSFGEVFGTVYDLSTISILWFAGASAMAGLLNLVPRYLPRYGMAPGVDEGDAAAGAPLHGDHVPHHPALRRRRRRAGRRLRHGRAGADDVRGGRSDAADARPAGATSSASR